MTYTVTVRNAGPGAAADVTVDTAIRKAKIVWTKGAACSVSHRVVHCHVGSIAAGASKQFTIVVEARNKPVKASSTVSSRTADPNLANNSDTEITAIAP